MSADNTVDIEALPQCESSQIKRNWGAMAREVREQGRIAITTHKRIEMVLMSASEYNALMRRVAKLESRQHGILDELEARFDERLARLQAPDAAGNVDGFFDARGQAKVKPKAGTF